MSKKCPKLAKMPKIAQKGQKNFNETIEENKIAQLCKISTRGGATGATPFSISGVCQTT